MVGTGLIALAAALANLRRIVDLHHVRDTWFLSITCSAPVLTMIITGQSSALIALCIVAGAGLWTKGRHALACGMLGLLALKPNWGAFFGLLLIVRGDWRGATWMLAVVAALCATTLPLSREMWLGFLHSSLSLDRLFLDYEPFKFVTLRGFFDGVLCSPMLARASWTLTSGALVVAAAKIWRATAPPIEHLAATVLLVIAANPYVQFYDALVLFLPASVWWTQRDRWQRAAWHAVGLLIAVVWLWEHAIWTWGLWFDRLGAMRPAVSLIGPACSIWLLVWAAQARRA
jgi:hypothetical protein